MKKLDVQITKAEIKNFTVELRDDLPDVTASIVLYTENKKEIATFTVHTADYYSGPQFDLPAQMIPAIKDIAAQLEEIVVQKCNQETVLLCATTLH